MLDLFGMSRERRMERALITEFEATLEQLLEHLSADSLDDAVDIVNDYQEIRGYGPVKELAAGEVRERVAGRLAAYAEPVSKAA
jgi:indolepyruvate ferredoxin oxidoreductase